MVNDPIDLFKDAWGDIDPPLPPDDLAQADALTRGTVTWLRSAWARMPAAQLPADDLAQTDATTRATAGWLRSAWADMPAAQLPVDDLAQTDVTTRATTGWLRSAWTRMPVAQLPATNLAQSDATTRATAGWLRSAWTRMPVAQPVPVARGQRRRAPRVLSFLSPLKAAAGFLFLTLSIGAIQSHYQPNTHGPVASATPTALDGRLAREWNTFVVPEQPSQAAMLPIGALDADFAAHLAQLAFGSSWLAGVLPGAGDAEVDVSAALQAMRDSLVKERWSDVARQAHALLEQRKLPQRDRCDALLALAWSAQGLGRSDEAAVYAIQLAEERARLAGSGVVVDAPAADGLPTAVPAMPGKWPVAAPGDLGLNPTVINRHLKLAQESGADAVLVVLAGRIVSEWYSPEYDATKPCRFDAGATLSLLCGALANEGRIDLDVPLAASIHDLAAGGRERMTLRQLLTHTSGMDREVVGTDPFLTAVVSSPGEAFRFSQAGVSALAVALGRITGLSAARLVADRLFNPLGLGGTSLVEREGLAPQVLSSPREMARLGQLVLQQGRVGHNALVPASWLDVSSAPGHHRGDAGYLWWVCDEPSGIASLGALDNNLYIFPQAELVVVRAQLREKKDSVRSYEPEALSLFSQMTLGPADGF